MAAVIAQTVRVISRFSGLSGVRHPHDAIASQHAANELSNDAAIVIATIRATSVQYLTPEDVWGELSGGAYGLSIISSTVQRLSNRTERQLIRSLGPFARSPPILPVPADSPQSWCPAGER